VVTSWLVKVIVGILVAGFIVIEAGSPLVARSQADDAAHEIADEVAFQLGSSYTQPVLDNACKTEAHKRSVTADCTVDAQRVVHVTAHKKAYSLVLGRLSATKDWYHVKVDATAPVK